MLVRRDPPRELVTFVRYMFSSASGNVVRGTFFWGVFLTLFVLTDNSRTKEKKPQETLGTQDTTLQQWPCPLHQNKKLSLGAD